ncbi:MAG: DNA polymerase I [Ruminococcaceae bacterium]|nr:DNA polymerase I [Oscillospiraceae bacterium]
MKKFLLIDANSILNRAYYAIRPLTNKDGLNTNGIFGFLNILLKELEEEKPDLIACCFDVSRVTFRTAMYGDYKGTRKETPPELKEQFAPLKELLSAMNIPVLEKENYEADDIIGTLSRVCSENQTECLILTGDKDDLQLVDEYVNVKLIITRMGKTETTRMDIAAVAEKYEGLEPKDLIELKAIMGDKSDNIPGVAGIGEVGGLKLISEYKTLENIYENIDSVKESLKKKLLADKENAFLSRDLGRIFREVPVDTDMEHYQVKSYNFPELQKVLENLNFLSFVNRLIGDAKSEPEEDILLLGADEFFRKKTSDTIYYLIDDGNFLVGDGENVYQIPTDDTRFLEILKSENIKKITAGVKAQLHSGLVISEPYADVLLTAYVCDPRFNDGDFSKIYRNFTDVHSDSLVSFAKHLPTLYGKLSEEVLAKDLFYIDDMEHHLIGVLYGMETEGVKIDEEHLNGLSAFLSQTTEELAKKIYEQAGEVFNILSPKQLGTILFEKLELPVVKKTKSGYSTNAEVLEKLSGMHPIIDLVKEYRQVTKLNSTYVEGFRSAMDENGILRTTYQQTLTQTGRLSSTEPNLQNIPIRTEEGRKIRQVILPKNDLFISADYSQIELRVLAHISGDENLIAAFMEGEDVHTSTAKRIFATEEVTAEHRRAAKAVNFGLIYGKGAFSLAKDLGISRYEAQEYIKRYLGQYPKVETYMAKVIEDATRNGYTKTLYHRIRYFPELNGSNHMMREAGKRAALNSPIQGTAADIIKLAMLRVAEALKPYKSKLSLQIHDELVIDCVKEEEETVKQLLRDCMENAVSLAVPLTVSISSGKNLDDCK